jgi:hypothetical protein
MMTVKFRTICAHPTLGCMQPGHVKEVDDAFGKELIAGGYAEDLGRPDPPAPVRESAAMKGGKEKAVKSAAVPKDYP